MSQLSGGDVDVQFRDVNCRTLNAQTVNGVTRSLLAQDNLAVYKIPVHWWRVWDAPQTNLPGTPATDDLGIIYNTFLTGFTTIETGDLKAAGSTTRRAYCEFPIPPEYVDAQSAVIRANAGMKTTVADTAATLDFEVVRLAAPTTDLYAGAALDINNLVAADKDFALTTTALVRGDLLGIRLSVLVNDAATGTAVIGQLNSVALLLDIKG